MNSGHGQRKGTTLCLLAKPKTLRWSDSSLETTCGTTAQGGPWPSQEAFSTQVSLLPASVLQFLFSKLGDLFLGHQSIQDLACPFFVCQLVEH
ncbi:hypothetical protein TNCV_957321 [Trichonephila clavipes]|nr:hypothetical protein TNCV_957321 [Trichonephila clavipes]